MDSQQDSQYVSPPTQKPKRAYRKKLPAFRPPTLRKEALFPSDEEDDRKENIPSQDTQHLFQKEEEQRPSGELQLPRVEPNSRSEGYGKRPRNLSLVETDSPYVRYGPYYRLCEKCTDNLLARHKGALRDSHV